MAIPTAFIRRVTLQATGDDAADALRVLHGAEAVLRRAVEAAAATIGGEVLVLRRVSFDIAVDLDGPQALAAPQMERALRSATLRPIAQARAAPSHDPLITEHFAWFPDESSAIAELLRAHGEGRASQWPFDLLVLWGLTPNEILRACLARERSLLADVLARAARLVSPAALVALVGSDLAAAIVHAFTESVHEGDFAARALPLEVQGAIAEELARLASASAAERDFATLAHLFARWPPARGLRVPVVELRVLGGSVPSPPEGGSPTETLARSLEGVVPRTLIDALPPDAVAAILAVLRGSRDDATLGALWARLEAAGLAILPLRTAVEGSKVRRLVSAAGGLVAWSVLFASENLWSEIDGAYPLPRARGAIRWALGCALEDARIGGIDPLLYLWSCEDPESPIHPQPALDDADPEILHSCALRLAQNRGLVSGSLEAAPLGDYVVLTGDAGFCVDAVLEADVNRAIPELVRRFARRTGKPPSGVRVGARMATSDLDALAELDVPRLAEPWRAAVRAFASVARAAMKARWRATVADLRAWPAILEIGHRLSIELPRSEAMRLTAGGWLTSDGTSATEVMVGAGRVVLRMK